MTNRFFVDPKAGGSYATGERLTSTAASAVMTSLREVDESEYVNGLRNFQAPAVVHSSALVDPHAAYDESLGIWAMAYVTGGAVKVKTTGAFMQLENQTVPASAATPVCAITNNAGKFLFGLDPGGSSASKILESSNGTTWTLRTCGSADTKSVRGLAWDEYNSLFIALVSTTSNGSTQVYTSPDGITWTSRTVAAGITGYWPNLQPSGSRCIAVNTAGLAVALSTTTAYMTSTDGGVTWTDRTGPTASANSTIAYSAALDRFIWTNSTGTGYVSSDGINWSAFTTLSWSGTAVVDSIGPTVILSGGKGGVGAQGEIWYSYDETTPATWVKANRFVTTYTGWRSTSVSNNQILIFADDATNTAVFASHCFG